jgi:Cu-Zn family superoxide dismutase
MNRRASLAAALAVTAMAVAAVAPRVVHLSSAQAEPAAVAPPLSAQAASTAGGASVPDVRRASADLVGPGGRRLGTATLAESPRGVLISVQARGLPPGRHGFHIHAMGDCGDTKFERAGGHLHAATSSVHGLLNPQATDTGDLPNLVVAPGGRLDAELFSSFVTLGGGGGRQPLLDADGAALILHANADDHMSQPIGGAGARIACAVIKPVR